MSKYAFKMVGNLCVVHGTTLAAVVHETDEPENVEEEDRTYQVWRLREIVNGKVEPREGRVTLTGHEFEMVHEIIANAAGALEDVVEGVHEEDEIADLAETLDLLARLLGA